MQYTKYCSEQNNIMVSTKKQLGGDNETEKKNKTIIDRNIGTILLCRRRTEITARVSDVYPYYYA